MTTSKRIEDCLLDFLNAVDVFGEYTEDRERDLVSYAKELEQAKSLIMELCSVNGDTSDGYHTFNELYEFRLLYNAHLFNEWYKSNKYHVHKSKLHSDGTEPFGGGWFVVSAELLTGQITNHYEMKDWDLFQVEERIRANKWDGHTAQDVADRLREQLQKGKL